MNNLSHWNFLSKFVPACQEIKEILNNFQDSHTQNIFRLILGMSWDGIFYLTKMADFKTPAGFTNDDIHYNFQKFKIIVSQSFRTMTTWYREFVTLGIWTCNLRGTDNYQTLPTSKELWQVHHLELLTKKKLLK